MYTVLVRARVHCCSAPPDTLPSGPPAHSEEVYDAVVLEDPHDDEDDAARNTKRVQAPRLFGMHAGLDHIATSHGFLHVAGFAQGATPKWPAAEEHHEPRHAAMIGRRVHDIGLLDVHNASARLTCLDVGNDRTVRNLVAIGYHLRHVAYALSVRGWVLVPVVPRARSCERAIAPFPL